MVSGGGPLQVSRNSQLGHRASAGATVAQVAIGILYHEKRTFASKREDVPGVRSIREVYSGVEGDETRLDSSADGETCGCITFETSWNGRCTVVNTVWMTPSTYTAHPFRYKRRVSRQGTHVRVVCGDMKQLDVIHGFELIKPMWVSVIHPVRRS